MGDNNILTFCLTVLDKKCHFSVYFLTHLRDYSIKETGCIRLKPSHMIPFHRMRDFCKCLVKSDKQPKNLVI